MIRDTEVNVRVTRERFLTAAREVADEDVLEGQSKNMQSYMDRLIRLHDERSRFDARTSAPMAPIDHPPRPRHDQPSFRTAPWQSYPVHPIRADSRFLGDLIDLPQTLASWQYRWPPVNDPDPFPAELPRLFIAIVGELFSRLGHEHPLCATVASVALDSRLSGDIVANTDGERRECADTRCKEIIRTIQRSYLDHFALQTYERLLFAISRVSQASDMPIADFIDQYRGLTLFMELWLACHPDFPSPEDARLSILVMFRNAIIPEFADYVEQLATPILWRNCRFDEYASLLISQWPNFTRSRRGPYATGIDIQNVIDLADSVNIPRKVPWYVMRAPEPFHTHPGTASVAPLESARDFDDWEPPDSPRRPPSTSTAVVAPARRDDHKRPYPSRDGPAILAMAPALPSGVDLTTPARDPSRGKTVTIDG